MTYRRKTAYSGDLGEVRAIEQFLHMGASVNSLTASDYGWDLHIHLPEEAMFFSLTPPQDGWVLSGRTAHVQVKRRSANSWPSLNTETVRGWLTGTATGTPTIVFIVTDTDPRETEFRFCTPQELSSWLHHYQFVASGTLGERWTQTYDSQTFPQLLQLWARFPHVMGTGLIQPHLDTSTTPPDRMHEIALEIATGYCVHHRISFRDDPTDQEKKLTQAFMSRYEEINPVAAEKISRDLQSILRERASMNSPDQAIVSGGVPLAAYTQSVDLEDSLTAAVICSNWMAGIHS